MRKILLTLCVIAAMVAVANPAVAQIIDIVDYMDVTPGQWKTEHSEGICYADPWDGGISISTSGIYTLSTFYENVGGNWIRGSVDVFRITQDNLMWLGDYDYETGVRSVYSPPHIIPRSLGLNQPVFNSGTVTAGSETEPYSDIFMITETGVSVTTPAGTFDNCIKIKAAGMSEEDSYAITEIWAPGMGFVRSFEATIEEVGGTVEVELDVSDVTGYGGP